MKRQIDIVSIAIALIAMLFFEYGIWQLSFLTNVDIADAVRRTGRAGSLRFSAVEITNYAVVISVAHFAGFFVAGVLSFILSERKRVDLYESLIAFMFFWGLAWLGLTNLKYFSIIAKLPGSGINGYPFFVVNGCIWILVGLAILVARKRYLLKTKETRRLATNAD